MLYLVERSNPTNTQGILAPSPPELEVETSLLLVLPLLLPLAGHVVGRVGSTLPTT